MAQQTAVEWLMKQLLKYGFLSVHDLKHAKEMEKEQIKKAYEDGKNLIQYKDEWGERYYNEQYGK